jgi:hypothetical protein
VVPVIGNPIFDLILLILPSNVEAVFGNSLIAAALPAVVVACALSRVECTARRSDELAQMRQ